MNRMVFYNIADTRTFFEKLNHCLGVIDIIAGDGAALAFSKSTDSNTTFPLAYSDGYIKKIELVFHQLEDAYDMLHFLMTGPKIQ